jgi:eukaryotic-like serine/threonine-protein kinase
MTPARWRKVEEIYQSALERAPAERARFLAEACGGDTEVRAEVESLLEHDGQSGGLIDRPAWQVGRDLLATQQLDPGKRLGSYEIVELIGAGGMGQVYRATDTRLRRTVAVKVLPPGRFHGPELKRRFLQEARAASALKHPNIVTIHDIASQDGVDYLVMEHIAGKPLDKTIPPKGLPLRDALAYAIQISSALAAAHTAGIVHRDIKPANIMITAEAQTKILDFGLAKLAEAPASAGNETITQHPSLTTPGMVVGTVAYMSPEQAAGRELDHRTDIFSLGVVLYEMLSGRRPFQGGSPVEIMHSIMHDAPPPLAGVPPEVDQILAKALAKDLRDRYRHVGDLELDARHVERGLETGSLASMRPATAASDAKAGPRMRRRERLIWAAAMMVVAIAAGLVAANRFREVPSRPLRFSVVMPPTATWTTLHTVSLSRDGRHLAFVAANPQGNDVIWVRSLGSLDSQPIPGTEGAVYPFWSSTNRFIGFFDGVSLKKVEAPLNGRIIAPPQVLSDAPTPRGGSWRRDGTILFSSAGTIYSVPEAGGTRQPILKPSESQHAYSWPESLPDGKSFLCLESSPSDSAIHLASIGSSRFLLKADSNPVLARAGAGDYVLFVRGNTLMAQRLNETWARIEGEAISIAQAVARDNFGHVAVSSSDTDSLAFGTAETPQFWWYDRSGKLLASIADSKGFNHPALSPDEKFLAADGAGAQGGDHDIWMLDLARGGMWRFTGGPGAKFKPAWYGDGRGIVFVKYPGPAFYQRTKDGTEELVFRAPDSVDHYSLSADGRMLAYDVNGEKTKNDLWLMPLDSDGPRRSTPLLQTPFNEDQPQFSPDGRWLAYESDDSGRYESYVQRISGGVLSAAERFQVSREGGFQPVWRADGKEMFFLGADRKLMAVAVRSDANRFSAGEPKTLFQTNVTGGRRVRNHYLVTRDGQRILISAPREKANAEPITVVMNWTSGLLP